MFISCISRHDTSEQYYAATFYHEYIVLVCSQFAYFNVHPKPSPNKFKDPRGLELTLKCFRPTTHHKQTQRLREEHLRMVPSTCPPNFFWWTVRGRIWVLGHGLDRERCCILLCAKTIVRPESPIPSGLTHCMQCSGPPQGQ